MANVISGMRESGRIDREEINDIMAQTLRGNPNFNGVWGCWEPNGFDGKDADFVDTEGHDGTGRFIPYWYRDGGKVLLIPLTEYGPGEDNEWYVGPLNGPKATITEPYFDDQINKVVISLIIPLEAEGKRVGVVGVDLDMAPIDGIIGDMKLYETGFGRLMSYTGTLASHPDKARIGEIAGELKGEAGAPTLRKIQSGESFLEVAWSQSLGQNTLKAFAPIQVIGTDTPWSLGVVLREDEVLASSMRVMTFSLIVSMAGALLIAVLVWLIVRQVVRPIKRVVHLASMARDGDLTITREDFNVRSQDEIGIMADAFSAMIADLAGEITDDLDRIALSSESNATRSRQSSDLADETIETIRAMREEISDITMAIHDLAAVSEEQSASSEEIASAVQNIASQVAAAAGSVDVIRTQMTEVSTSAERVALGAEDLSGLSEGLRLQIGAFKIERDNNKSLEVKR